nr:heme exporter protein CcmB [Nitrococcus mobilis]
MPKADQQSSPRINNCPSDEQALPDSHSAPAEQTLRSAFFAVLLRDLLLANRSRADYLNPVVFFLLIATLFPLAVSIAPENLRAIGPGVFWVAAVLASVLSMEQLFRSDFDDGTLEQFAIAPQALSIVVLAKLLAHWLVTALPLILVSPLLVLFYQLPVSSVAVAMLTLAAGTPAITATGALGVALTVSVRRGGVLLSLLVLPLYVPVLIFGASAIDQAAHGLPIQGPLLFLSALSVLSISLMPWAIAAALRITLE